MSLYVYWAPDPDNVPPWAENKEGWWYCRACWKYLDHKHVETGQHIRRVYYWMQQHSVALSAAWSAARSAEAGPSAARSATEWADRESVNREDLAELLVCLRGEQGSASAEAVPSAGRSAADGRSDHDIRKGI